MKTFASLFILLLLIPACQSGQDPISELEPISEENSEPMRIVSSAFSENQAIPAKYTCQGDDVNPPLTITDVPVGTKSLVLIVDDPDAPAGKWVHWLLWNIPPDTQEIPENFSPRSPLVEGTTSFGSTGYGGPCPPSGTHRYYFKLYALDIELDLPTTATLDDVESQFGTHTLSTVQLIGTYAKQ